MNDNRYKECLNKIDKYYKSNPDITTNELEKTIYNIEYNVLTKNSSIGPKKILDIDIVWIYRVAFVIIVLAIGLVDILNNSFDGEIYVKEVSLVCDSFHARYDVKSKIYSYYINMGEFSPVNRNYQYQYCKCLDVSLMRKASMCLIGKHDFRAFCTDSKDKENCVRTIYSIDFDILGDILKITFEGDGFLRKMIRNIVGSLIEVGSLKKDVSYVSDILESNFRGGNLKCAPACGLYLDKVNY